MKYFTLEEFIPQDIHKQYGEHSGWFIDGRLYDLADYFRVRYGPITINDWKWGGNFQYSGLRPFDCEHGARLSQHKFGRAIDMKFKGVTPTEIRLDIAKEHDHFFDKGVRTLEAETRGWLHVDIRNTGLNHILIIGGK